MKKDYSYLKGKEVEMISPYGHTYKDCFVAQIDEEIGLTIVGTLVSWATEPFCESDRKTIGTERKVFCLRNEIAEHRKIFPFAVKAIEKGVIDANKIDKEAGVKEPFSRFGGQPTCAFVSQKKKEVRKDEKVINSADVVLGSYSVDLM